MDLWKPRIREKNLRILHTISYFLKVLSYKGQKLFWMTDNDAIVANKEQLEATAGLLQGLLDAYIEPGYFSTFGYALPFKETEPFDFGSFLSLSDLVAGAVADFFQRTAEVGHPAVSSDASDKISTWLALHGLLLKKLVFKIDKEADGQYSTSILEFILREPPPQGNMIGITF